MISFRRGFLFFSSRRLVPYVGSINSCLLRVYEFVSLVRLPGDVDVTHFDVCIGVLVNSIFLSQDIGVVKQTLSNETARDGHFLQGGGVELSSSWITKRAVRSPELRNTHGRKVFVLDDRGARR